MTDFFKSPEAYAEMLLNCFYGDEKRALTDLYTAARAWENVPVSYWYDVAEAIRAIVAKRVEAAKVEADLKALDGVLLGTEAEAAHNAKFERAFRERAANCLMFNSPRAPEASGPVGIYDKLSSYQLAALITFADSNGRNWKAELRALWSSGRNENSGALREIRNNLGPSYLEKITLLGLTTELNRRAMIGVEAIAKDRT